MSFIKKAYLSFSGSILLVLLNFFIGVMLARTLAPDGLGQYSLVLSFVTILSVIVSLGMGDASVYYINNKKRDPAEIVQAVIKTSFLLATITFFVVIILFQSSEYFGEITFLAIFYVALYGFCLVLSENFIKVMLAFMQINQYMLTQIVPVTIFLFFITISYFSGELRTENAWLYIMMGQVVGVVLLLYFLRKFLVKNVKTKVKDVTSLATYGSKLNTSYVALLLNNEIGLFIIRQLTTDFSEVGFYRLVIRLAGVLLIIPKSLSPLFYSKWSSTDEHVRVKEVERVSRLFFVLTIVSILAFEIVAEVFIVVIYGEAYLPAVPLLRIVLVGIGARFVMMPIFNLFSSSGRPMLSTYSLLVGLLVSVISMYILIPVYNGLGAGVAFAIGNCASLIVSYCFAVNKMNINLRSCFILTSDDIQFIRKKIFVK